MPTASPPVEIVEVAMVEVAWKLPKVGVVVETSLVPSNAMRVLLENDVAFVPPFAIPSVPLKLPRERHVEEIAKHPVVMLYPTFDVEVAWPEMFNPLTVVVPKPLPEISKAEMEVVASPATVVVEK